MAKACIGYSSVEMTLNCYLRPDVYDSIDLVPRRLLKQGIDAYVMSQQSGLIMEMPGLDVIRALPSFV